MLPGCSDEHNPMSSSMDLVREPEQIDSLYVGTVTVRISGFFYESDTYTAYVVVDSNCAGFGCQVGPRLTIGRRVVSYTWTMDPDAPGTPPTVSANLLWTRSVEVSGSQWSTDCVIEGVRLKASGYYSDTLISGSYEVILQLVDGSESRSSSGSFECRWDAMTTSEWPNDVRPHWLDCVTVGEPTEPTVTPRFFSVGWDGRQYLAGGNVIATSPYANNWTFRKQVGEDDIRQFVVGNDQIIGLGDNGTIVHSTDGIEWKRLFASSYSSIYGIPKGAYGGGRFVVVLSRYAVFSDVAGTIITTSTDGINWQPQIMPTTIDLHGVFWNGQEFVIIGRDRKLTSTDGVNWTETTTNNAYRFRNLVWTGSRYVAAANQVNCCIILASTDGVDWTELSRIDEYNSISFACSPDCFVTFGNDTTNSSEQLAFASPDGVTWKTLNYYSTSHLYDVQWCDDRFVAVGGNQMLISTDGINWTRQLVELD